MAEESLGRAGEGKVRGGRGPGPGGWAADLKLNRRQQCDVRFLGGGPIQGQALCSVLGVMFCSGHRTLQILFLISTSNLCSLQKI